MSIDFKEYWNNKYWKKFLGEKRSEDLDFLSDLWINKYIEVFDKIPRGKTIDLGCGLGQYTKYLMDKGFDVLSCDISAEVLKGLKENITNAKTLELDMSKPLPFNDNSFNLVFANLSIHYFDTNTTIELLREIRSIPGVKKVFVRSGIRYDYMLYDKNDEFYFFNSRNTSFAIINRMRVSHIGKVVNPVQVCR
jgi:SAM-dependent methyltransferase